MNGTDFFHSSRCCIEHAKRHIHTLETEISVFFNTNPYATVVETNMDGTEDIHKIKLVKPMPATFPLIAFDAINSLRSSLDQAGYAVAVAIGKGGNNAHFPFGNTDNDVNASHRRRSKDLPKEIFDKMMAFKPYKGGNDLLWALNKLCNSHKHEIIIPIAIYTDNMSYGIHNLVSSGSANTFPPRWDAAKNEMILARVLHGSEFNCDLQVQTFIAFAKVDAVLGQPAIPILNNMVGIVERIIMALESEARRLGIIKGFHICDHSEKRQELH
jgi:hypothetical protein